MTPTAVSRKPRASELFSWRETLCARDDLTPSEKLVALRLSFHYDLERGTAWRPQASLAADCAVSTRTVERAVTRLVACGALVVAEPASQHRATRFALGPSLRPDTLVGAEHGPDPTAVSVLNGSDPTPSSVLTTSDPTPSSVPNSPDPTPSSGLDSPRPDTGDAQTRQPCRSDPTAVSLRPDTGVGRVVPELTPEVADSGYYSEAPADPARAGARPVAGKSSQPQFDDGGVYFPPRDDMRRRPGAA